MLNTRHVHVSSHTIHNMHYTILYPYVGGGDRRHLPSGQSYTYIHQTPLYIVLQYNILHEQYYNTTMLILYSYHPQVSRCLATSVMLLYMLYYSNTILYTLCTILYYINLQCYTIRINTTLHIYNILLYYCTILTRLLLQVSRLAMSVMTKETELRQLRGQVDQVRVLYIQCILCEYILFA